MSTQSRERSRRMRTKLHLISVGATSGELLPANSNRVTLTFQSINAERWTASIKTVAVLDQGINIPAASIGQTIKEEDHADGLRGPWTAIASAAGQTVAVLESEIINAPDQPRATPGSV